MMNPILDVNLMEMKPVVEDNYVVEDPCDNVVACGGAVQPGVSLCWLFPF